MDGLLHRNRDGARFPTRLDDIRFLLSRGISVITTVNVYELEDVRDIARRLTGIRVSEKRRLARDARPPRNGGSSWRAGRAAAQDDRIQRNPAGRNGYGRNRPPQSGGRLDRRACTYERPRQLNTRSSANRGRPFGRSCGKGPSSSGCFGPPVISMCSSSPIAIRQPFDEEVVCVIPTEAVINRTSENA